MVKVYIDEICLDSSDIKHVQLNIKRIETGTSGEIAGE